MCGIAGFFCSQGVRHNTENTITRMLGAIVHRGPDEAGYYIDDYAAIGTVRLSIIDLAGGSQPIGDSSERYWICYNGELYNHNELRTQLIQFGYQFQTNCDTEVVLYSYIHWQEEALRRFNGAFAFCIYDARDRTLFAARDRFGKRPFYYTFQNGVFLFASEIKAFAAYPGFAYEFDIDQLISISTIWTPLPYASCFKGVHQLPHGQYLKLADDILDLQPWVGQNESGGNPCDSIDAAIDEVRQSICKSVELRLNSDVEVGVYLSGGLDSSIVTAAAKAYSGGKLNTFSVTFDDQGFDESSDQKIVSKHLGVANKSVRITDQDIAGHFADAVYHAEVPVFRTAFVPMFLLSKFVASEGIKVILSGEGADEAFLGYDIFRETLLRSVWSTLSAAQRKEKLKDINRFLNHFSDANINYLHGIYDAYSKESIKGLFSHEMRFNNGKFSSRIFNIETEFCEKIVAYIAEKPEFHRLSAVEKAQWLEFETLLAGYLLSTQGDRMCLSHGVENRCPFLDANVVAVAKKYNFKFDHHSEEKWLLRQAFSSELPEKILRKKKFPYRSPDSLALLKGGGAELEMILSAGERKKLPFLNEKFCNALVKKIMVSGAAQISPKEEQTFVFLYSLLLLNNRYLNRQVANLSTASRTIERILSKRIVRKGLDVSMGAGR